MPLALVLAGCGQEPSSLARVPPPKIDSARVIPNPHNVLSVVVRVHVRDADSVRIHFGLSSESSGIDSVTPAIASETETVIIPVLGLFPASEYVMKAVAFGQGKRDTSVTLTLTTDELPDDVPRYNADGASPSPGFVVFGAGSYGVVIDNTGRVVWYHRFANGPGLAFMSQPNGRFVARPPLLSPQTPDQWVEIDPLGNVTRTFGCARGLPSRLHDVIGQPDGSYWIMCDETRIMDLTASGGVAEARVTGTAVQHIDASGALLLEWSPFDHFAITDLDAESRSGGMVNWTHGNALDLDTDGNLLVSFRSLNEVTKIDVVTGDVRWRMGGLRNQFSFPDSPVPAFSRQHGVRVESAGRLVMLDNVGDPSESRAEHYTIDEALKVARLSRSYGATPGVSTLIGGSVQHLPNGRTLVSFGTQGRVEEYDETGNQVWQILGNAGYVFRAQRISSLYRPGVGSTR
jgi:hypothetical protein